MLPFGQLVADALAESLLQKLQCVDPWCAMAFPTSAETKKTETQDLALEMLGFEWGGKAPKKHRGGCRHARRQKLSDADSNSWGVAFEYASLPRHLAGRACNLVLPSGLSVNWLGLGGRRIRCVWWPGGVHEGKIRPLMWRLGFEPRGMASSVLSCRGQKVGLRCWCTYRIFIAFAQLECRVAGGACDKVHCRSAATSGLGLLIRRGTRSMTKSS